jgi:threonine/homoserine/homoserine lactone efflux protein
MLDYSVLPAFIVAALVIILSPGADTFVLLRSTLRGGVKSGFLTMLGIYTGIVILSVLLISGVGLLIARAPGALFWLQIIGALYLLYLALRSAIAGFKLVSEHRGAQNQAVDIEGAADVGKTSKLGPYVVGLLTNITNPKVLVFFLAFFPQFLGQAESPALQLTFLCGIFIGVSAVWLVFIVLAAHAMRTIMTTVWFTITMEFVVAAVFLVLAVTLLASGLSF